MENIKIKNGFQGERSLVMPEMILDLAEADPVLRTLHITDIGYYPHATYHYRERTESINQCVLIYCVKGSGHYSINGKQYEVKANQYFIMPAHTPHAYASNNDDPWTIYWIHFRGTLAHIYSFPRNIGTYLCRRCRNANHHIHQSEFKNSRQKQHLRRYISDPIRRIYPGKPAIYLIAPAFLSRFVALYATIQEIPQERGTG